MQDRDSALCVQIDRRDHETVPRPAAVYPKISERTTMYVCARDKALAVSAWLQDSERVGFTPPVTVVPGVDTIEVGALDLTLLGHDYFAEAEALLYDMKQVMEDSARAAERRLRLEGREVEGHRYWAIGA